MKRIRFEQSDYPGGRLLSMLWSTVLQRPLWRLGLFITTLAVVMLGHLGFFHSPAIADPNNQISILNEFSPSEAPPGEAVIYQLTFRNETGSVVNITSLSQTLPSSPGSLVFDATTPTLNECGGTFSVTNTGSNPGSPGSYTFTGGSIPIGDPGQCIIQIPVKGFEGGNHIDTIPAGVLFTDVGENPDPTSATLQVDASQDVTLSKSFSPNTIPGGGRSLVTITLTNPNDYDLTGTTTPPTLVDDLPSTPSQMTVDTRTGAPTPTTTCTGGTVQIKAGDTGIELVDGVIPADSSCTITFPVTQANGGTYTNDIPANSLNTVNQISNGNNANANLNIQTEVSISKNIAAGTLDEGETTNLTITVTNGGTVLTNANLTDPLPAPLVVANPANATTTCTTAGNPVSAIPGGTSVSLVNGEIPASDPDTNNLGECEISVDVTLDPGSQNNISNINQDTLTNTIPAGALTNTEGQTNAEPATDVVRARVALIASKQYSNNDTISPGATTRMEIRIQNRSNALAATGVSFTDSLPSPLEVATPLDVSYSNCGSGTLGAVAPGDTVLNFAGGTVPASSTCVIYVDMYIPPTATVGDNLDNVIANDSINNDQGFDSNGVTGSEGRLQVVDRIEITKAFVENTIRRGTTSQVVLRIENNRRSATDGAALPLTGVDITDNLPPNLQVANPANFSHTRCNYDTVAESFTGTDPVFTGITPGSTTFTMTDATLAPIDDGDSEADTCEIRFDVAEIDLDFNTPGNETPRAYTNTTSGFSNNEGESLGQTATANLTVISPLDGQKFFQSEQIVAGGRSAAVIQLDNTLPDPLTVVSFTDDWTQSNTVVADPANTSTTCGGGVVTTTPSTRSVTLTGGVVPAQVGNVLGLCEVRFDVEMDASGTDDTFTNTVGSGEITTNEGFTNPTDISGTLTRTTSNLNVNKAFSPTSLIVGDPSTLTVTVNNPNNGIPVTEFGFTDTMPAEMVVFSIPNASTTCTDGVVSANPGDTSFTLSGASLGSNQSCTVTVQVTLVDTGNSINEINIGQLVSKENVTNSQLAQATVNALAALRPAKSFNPTSVDGGIPSQLTLTIENVQADNSSGEVLQNVSITDTFPADLYVANTPNESTNCTGGIINVTPGGTVVSMTGATLAPQASCQIFVDVVSPFQGSYLNQIDAGDVTAQIQPSLGGTTIENTSRPQATLNVNNDSLPPEILLIKRITAINGEPIVGFDDGPDTDDNDPQWPSPTSDSLRGVINYTTPVVPGDELEYTIYYLNTGLGDADNMMMCDRVPEYTSFEPRGYTDAGSPAQTTGGLPGADRGIVLAEAGTEVSLTNANDGDTGYYFAPGISPETSFPGISCNGDSSNGTVVVGVPNTVPAATGAGTPPASYGYMRFKAKVN